MKTTIFKLHFIEFLEINLETEDAILNKIGF